MAGVVAAPAANRPHEAEADVGILEFLQPDLAGFACQLKAKWQDFHVYEVATADGELHLEELITPGLVIAERKAITTARREARAALGPEFEPEADVMTSLTEALGSAFVGEFLGFLRQQRPSGDSAGAADAEPPPGYLDLDGAKIGDGSKDARTRAHRAVLAAFESFLNTETVEGEGGARSIRIWMRDAEMKAKSRAGGNRGNDAGRDDGGKKGKGKDGKKGKGKGKGKKGKGKSKGGDEASEAAEDGAPVGGFGTIRHEGWPKDRPDYLYFRLHKENCDTGEAVSSVARCVGRSPKQFTFAGTKDKRAITVQMVCAHRLPADQLRRTVGHKNWDRRLRISNLEYRAKRLRLGELAGNRFRVVLRGVHGNAEVAEEAFRAIKTGGFLNYYGLQRFGTRTVGTHHIGSALISRDWSRTVRLLLGDKAALGKRKRVADSSDAEAEPVHKQARGIYAKEAQIPDEEAVSKEGQDTNQAKEVPTRNRLAQEAQEAQRIYLESGDAQRALDAMPRNQHLERCVLGALAKGLPPAEALKQLPHQAVSLYAHAAQSLVWNMVASRRVRELGQKAVVGDLVFVTGSAGASFSVPDVLEEEDAEMSGEDGDDGDGDDGQDHADAGNLPAVREITTPEEANEVSFFDVVLPLPGSEVSYPSCLRGFYEEVSASLGLSLADFGASTLVQLRGAYRHVAVLPKELEWKVVPSSEVKAAPRGVLIESDVQRLMTERPDWKTAEEASVENASKVADSSAAAEEGGGGGGAPAEPQKESGASVESDAVLFSVELPPSAYVTMLLREITKQPNSILSGFRS